MSDEERENVQVRFVADSDIEKHVNKNDGKTTSTRRLRRSTAILSGFVEQENKPDDNQTKPRKKKQPGALYNANKATENTIYTFKTPKRADHMNNFASEVAKRNRDLRKSQKKDDKSDEKHADKYSFQQMNVAGIDESTATEASESEEERTEDVTTTRRGFNLPTNSELYFEANKGTRLKSSTSNKTLSKLKRAQMDLDKYREILGTHDNTTKNKKDLIDIKSVEKSRIMLCNSYTKYFKKWMYWLLNGYNILLYGVGSKMDLISQFAKEYAKPFHKLTVNGFFPGISIKNVLMSIWEEVLLQSWTFGNNLEMAATAICEHYSDTDNEPLFLFVHNIEGSGLRNANAQNIFSRLSKCKRLFLVASIDHINAVLIWDQTKFNSFHWLWYDVTTYQPYTQETSYENSLLLLANSRGAGGSLALTGLLHVARSLTPNARGIFKVLAEYQIEETKDNSTNYNGYLFADLYQHCREMFLVNTELTLRTQLTEFLDHKLVQIKKGIDGGEYLTIPLDVAALEEYLEQESQSCGN